MERPDLRRAAAFLALATLFMALGLAPLAIACFMVLVARLRLAGEVKLAGGAVALAAALPVILLNSFMVALACAAGAAMGFGVAFAIERQWSFGRQLALVAGTGFAAMAGAMLSAWQALRHNNTIFINARIAELNAQEGDFTAWIEMLKWSDLNYDNVALGSAFGSILIVSAVALALVERTRRSPEEIQRRRPSGFQRMRVPDWMVWFAIAAALIWLADFRWPHPALRAISWNAAIALNCLYWLNGVSILLYALTVFKASFLGLFMVLSGLFVFGLWPLLGVFGLFDTWYDFRMRFRRLAMLRRVAFRPDDRDE